MRGSVAVIVGHIGPKTGAWWQDDTGLLDEWALAQETAISVAFGLQARGWRTYMVTSNRHGDQNILDKCRMVRLIAPDLAISIHYGSNARKASRGNKWPGCSGTMFADGWVPDESSFAAGVNICYYEDTVHDSLRPLCQRLVALTTETTDLTVANDDGLDPRPIVSRPGYKRLGLLVRCDPVCPTLIYEACSLSSPLDRKVLRGDIHIFDKLAFCVGEAANEWWVEHEC